MLTCGECLAEGPGGEGTPCTELLDRACSEKTICDVDAGQCRPRPELGDECTPSRSECYPHDCETTDTDDVYRCIPYPRLGEDCSRTLHCLPDDSYCDPSKECLARPEPGQDCGRDAFTGEAIYCADNAYCDKEVDPPLCRELPGDGEPCRVLESGWTYCDDSSHCPPGGDAPVCRALPGPGEPCSEAEPCVGRLYCGCLEGFCNDRICIRIRFPGESCAEPYERCLDTVSKCRKGVCVVLEGQDRFEELCRPPESEE